MSKPKQIKFSLIDAEEIPELEPYRLMREVRKFHRETADAKIALAWRIDTNPDVDGRLVLGRCIKASDLQRELVDWDFVILLNKEVWDDPGFTADKKKALLDHELCHAAVAFDNDGPKIDSRGRKVWRIRKHDIEEFQDIISRHGCYKRDLERFAEVLIARKQSPLFQKDQTTVQIGFENDKGEMEYTEPMRHSEFIDACEQITGKVQ
jgi:hypothetical protein